MLSSLAKVSSSPVAIAVLLPAHKLIAVRPVVVSQLLYCPRLPLSPSCCPLDRRSQKRQALFQIKPHIAAGPARGCGRRCYVVDPRELETIEPVSCPVSVSLPLPAIPSHPPHFHHVRPPSFDPLLLLSTREPHFNVADDSQTRAVSHLTSQLPSFRPSPIELPDRSKAQAGAPRPNDPIAPQSGVCQVW